MLLDICFFARTFAPRPRLVLKLGHMIDIAYIYHVSQFQQQKRSRSKTSCKKTVARNVLTIACHWTDLHEVLLVLV